MTQMKMRKRKTLALRRKAKTNKRRNKRGKNNRHRSKERNSSKSTQKEINKKSKTVEVVYDDFDQEDNDILMGDNEQSEAVGRLRETL